MNWDQIEGNWKQFKGKIREKWGRLTDDELESIAGSKDRLVGALQQKYGVAKEEAERQLREWQDKERF
ncbi:MAG TPA: CsbD family protein [bacterium]|nr:CsbD family protein [bacterium]